MKSLTTSLNRLIMWGREPARQYPLVRVVLLGAAIGVTCVYLAQAGHLSTTLNEH